MDDDPLALDPDTMRRLGYRTVDLLVDRLAASADGPVLRTASRVEMEARLREPPPPTGRDFDGLLGRLDSDVLPFGTQPGHPGYFAFIPGAGTWPGALGDFVASALNIDACWWAGAAGPSQLELVVVDWFKEWVGYPAAAAGILVGGGSAANMTALACAREALFGPMSDRVVAYVADQAHSSLARAARILGFRPDQVRVLPVDGRYRMRPDALVAAMDADLGAGRRPLFVAASAGSTNTGAVDPLPALAAICRDRGVWFHVDAAYGGFAVLTDRGREALQGMELADSVTLDPHKWLYQPYECGCLLVRQGHLLREAFEITPDYLKDVAIAEQEVNFSDLGMQLTRSSRALKVWLSLQFFGTDAFRAAIDRSLDLAWMAQRRIEESERFELLNPAELGVVCFRRRFDGVDDEDELTRLNAALVDGLAADGRALVSSTRLRGRYALRLCVLNHTSSAADVERAIGWLERAPRPRTEAAAPPSPGYDRDPDVRRDAWLDLRPMDAAEVSALPLFRSLPEAELAAVAASAHLVEVAAGETVVRQWEPSREFYVILDGAAEARSGDALLNPLGPGDFFGELAALDWGAGFGYPRLASVVATAPTRLLVLPPGRFNALVRQVPGFGRQIERAARERLPRV